MITDWCPPVGCPARFVDGQGAVSDVVIPAQWRDTVRPRDLGQVLLEAVNKVIANRVTSQVEQLDLGTPVERPVFSHRDAPSAGGDPTSPVAESLVNEVLDPFPRRSPGCRNWPAIPRH